MLLAAQSLIGVITIPLLAYALSENRRALGREQAVRICAAGLALQLVIAVILLKLPQSQVIFSALGRIVSALQAATEDGMRFVFGYLAGAPAPFAVTDGNATFLLGFRALPLILLMSVLSRLLYHWGILQRVVGAFAWVLGRALGVGGPLGTAAAANVLLGMVEAPLLVRPYLKSMGRGALFATMTVGMATVAGTVMALYASVLERSVPGAAGHLLVGSIMNVPAALLIARLMVPDGFEQAGPPTDDASAAGSRSTMDAIAQGTADGIQLLGYVTAMLVVMVALVSLANGLLGFLTAPLGIEVTFQKILGVLAAPLAFVIGVPAGEAGTAGSLIGNKLVLNELIAYLDLSRMPEASLSPRSRLLITYALCGFANLGSLGILVGGMTAMVPERRAEIVELGLKTVLAGTLATLLTASVVGVLVWS